jgi:predicted nucleotidyltransferase
MLNQHLEIDLDQIAAFCERHHIRKLSLFGSVLREDFRPDSDVDVLVEFESELPITYFDMADMQFELEAMLGREVDLLTPQEISRYFRQQVLNTAVLLYER